MPEEMCFHVCELPSPVTRSDLFPTLCDEQSAYGTHLALHTGGDTEVVIWREERTDENLAGPVLLTV